MSFSCSNFICYTATRNLVKRRFIQHVGRVGNARCLTTQNHVHDRISGIWYIPKADITDYESVIAKLPQLLPSRRKHLTTAIFFATPSIAKWFAADHAFLQAAVNRIYRPVLSETPPTSILAVVDALPSPRFGQHHKKSWPAPFRGAEGLALCLISGLDTSSTYLSHTSELPLIHFCSGLQAGPTGTLLAASASLQVANTLFVNGAKSTLLRQNWTVAEDARGPKWVHHGQPEPLGQLSIPTGRPAQSFLQFGMRLETMTKPRKVVSSMGNVVREVEGDDGSVIKASTELEIKVPEFLKVKQSEFGAGRVEVYALLVPPGDGADESHHKHSNQDGAITFPSSPDPGSNETARVKSLIHQALWCGGRLHKVTGGGGGWGKKAGLLSLDTSTNFEAVDKFEISMFPSFDENGDLTSQKTDAEEAIPADWSIQFLATFVGPEQDPYERLREHPDGPSNWTSKRWSWNNSRTSLIIGTTDSKDEQPVNDKQLPRGAGKVIAVPNIFGMLSPGGICLSSERKVQSTPTNELIATEAGSVHQFRVDAPHTMFHTTLKGLELEIDRGEAEDAPTFESSSEGQSQVLGPLLNDALRKSRKSSFRGIQFQPKPKFEVPPNRLRDLSIRDKAADSKPDDVRFRIRKYSIAQR